MTEQLFYGMYLADSKIKRMIKINNNSNNSNNNKMKAINKLMISASQKANNN